MKKVFLFIVASFIGLAGTKAYLMSQEESHSSLMLENIEALSKGEEPSPKVCYNSITSKEGTRVRYCPTCSYIDGTDLWFSFANSCMAVY